MRSRWFVLVLVAGCGRLGFSPDTGERDAAADGAHDAWVCGGAYRSLVLTDHPVAYWRMDETGGTTFADATGHGYDATISGTPTFSGPCDSQPRDQYMALADGTSGAAISQPFKTALDNATIEVWLRVPNAENWPLVFGRDSWAYDYGLGVTATNWIGASGIYPVFGHYYLVGTTSCSTCAAQSSVAIADNAWHHVVGTLVNTSAGNYTYTIYVDGVETGSQSGTEGSTASPDGALIIGQGGSFPFTGGLADLALYDYALPPARVLAHYQQ